DRDPQPPAGLPGRRPRGIHVPRRAGRVRTGRAGLRRPRGQADARLRSGDLWMSRALAGLALALALLAPTACESTQAKSAARKAKGAKLVHQKGLDVKQRNENVQIVA